MAVHSDLNAHVRKVAANLRTAQEEALLTDTTVAAADTVAGLKTAIDNAVVHAAVLPTKDRVKRAIDAGAAAGELTDAAILSLTTVAGLIALIPEAANDANREQFLE